MKLQNKMKMIIGLVLASGISVGAQADSADPIMGANFQRNVECSARSIQKDGFPRDASLLILGKYSDMPELHMVLAAKGNMLRGGGRLSQLPQSGERIYRAEIFRQKPTDGAPGPEYVMAHITIDLNSGTGSLVSSVEPYLQGSFELSNCRIVE